MFYGYDWSIIILIPAMIFAFVAQGMVNSAFKKYSSVPNGRGLSGAAAARYILDRNGLSDVQIVPISGSLTDNYNPMNRTLNLSQTVYDKTSISAVSVACHEAGHAMQHAEGYAPLKIRNSIVPVVNFSSRFSWILIMIGLALMFTDGAGGTFGYLMFNLGVIAFVLVLVFHVITLPVEFDASNRALKQMQEYDVLAPDDVPGAKKVLRAAAMTYVAAVAMAAANLIRILVISRRD
ncbi:MAG: zinc metallopeptidase [Eubacterium sp.]|nr:zinc metallopeptidase [Eubacterium sp.]